MLGKPNQGHEFDVERNLTPKGEKGRTSVLLELFDRNQFLVILGQTSPSGITAVAMMQGKL